MSAVNDFIIGHKSHVSAKYHINVNNQTKVQSSSGIFVSTGLGSTGRFKVFYMVPRVIFQSITMMTLHMSQDCRIFTDGVEDDYLEFNSGAIVRIVLAEKKGRLVI